MSNEKHGMMQCRKVSTRHFHFIAKFRILIGMRYRILSFVFAILGIGYLVCGLVFNLFSWLGVVGILFALASAVFLCIDLFCRRAQTKIPYQNPYVDVSLYDGMASFPLVQYHSMTLTKEERVLYAVPAVLRIYGRYGAERGSGRFRTGAGDYVITNRRIAFIGELESFESRLGDVTAVKVMGHDSFLLVAGCKSWAMEADSSQIPYAVGLTQTAVKAYELYE